MDTKIKEDELIEKYNKLARKYDFLNYKKHSIDIKLFLQRKSYGSKLELNSAIVEANKLRQLIISSKSNFEIQGAQMRLEQISKRHPEVNGQHIPLEFTEEEETAEKMSRIINELR